MKISYEQATIASICLHKVGNKTNGEGIVLSQDLLVLDGELREVLFKYFVDSFQHEELYTFYHRDETAQNPVYEACTKVFASPEQLYEQSVQLAQTLYNQSTHPNIKSGEFYVAYFQHCTVDNQPVDAIGIFKSENKDTFLKISPKGKNFEIESQRGTNIKKLDKGCLVFNIEPENGYTIAIVDNTNRKNEAKYWTDHFLHVRARKDSFAQTKQILSVCKDFVNQLPTKTGKAEKAAYLNRSLEALKEKTVDINNFAKQVFETPQRISEFQTFSQNYQQERNIQIDERFHPAAEAVKRTAFGTMTTIKLDRNFDIHIHGGEQYIVRGYDKEKDMYYYQLYFKNER